MQTHLGKYFNFLKYFVSLYILLCFLFRYQHCIDLWRRALEIRVEKDSVREIY